MEVTDVGSFLKYFESIRGRTMRVVKSIPAEKLEWRHCEGVFSPGDLARHIAAVERLTFGEGALGRPSLYAGCGAELADGLENVIAYMERMHAETVELLRGVDLKKKGRSPQGVEVAPGRLLQAMIEHEIHHRGEMYVYLALLGVERPPLY